MRLWFGSILRAAVLSCLLWGAFAQPASAQTGLGAPNPALTQDRFWLLWERVKFAGRHCPDGAQCVELKSYSSRPLTTNNTGFIYRLFGLQGGLHKAAELPKDHAEAPNICRKNKIEAALGFDPMALPKSEKGEVLRGVDALHLDLTGLKAPPGFSSDFGPSLHKTFVRKLQAAGIEVVDKDALPSLDGQPTLNLYFSFSDPEDLCDYQYSVFASLSQDVLLTRDPRIKVAAGVWSFSTGSSARDHSGNERDAILRVAEAFVRDHQKVNGR
ncbi:hypothetical protein J7399_02170 [Shimia sp. R9_1]|uniref:hypothetical protein n=1 Tax=Shimia sp. R9_1 TaxID=2821111 RepID=UPI001ADAD3EC|nr:hypothetical protein [Shimia sp. R9_1]MBO9406219.1 hypothetical protein [Shimia sp. R9_1]